ncbi:hypothetical protein BU24DRAFT_434533 [Aaosphaeria arxii CBS 175.79]|uniref:Uncharacterized protein n=1 Tax=Aaosphaeria arxii CBS 175.79 TaxID=1450172 RepID=A0A6A5XL24_9PLEO|nr:uncharacterized protein BU24DRAFT_434533 [Aaosphaeria arxii CBS 175.79]KAF2013507.1 hypothetical protein BU24DRAFT_434533 [Aaosphaeria arxii CBS 175.79]
MSDKIFYGVWINWSRGQPNGSTITLSASNANVLVAFLAIFVSVSGAALWRILAFTLHQRRITRHERDGMHYQHQNILRNTPSPGIASWQLIWLIPPWSKVTSRSFLRTFPLILVALLNLSVFLTAGILVAEVTRTAGTDVLVRSGSCGTWLLGDTDLVLGPSTKVLNDTISAAAYARACYGGQSETLECNQYVKQALPFTTELKNQSEACPFEDGMCLIRSPVYILDTGNLSSHEHFGINAKTQDRVTYRRKTICAPIKTKDFIDSFNCTDAKRIDRGRFSCSEGDIVDLFKFGDVGYHTNPRSNYTHAYNRRAASVGYGYALSSVDYSSGDGDEVNAWRPVPALHRNDGDISLMFLSANEIKYYGMVKDPIFQATTVSKSALDNGKNVTFYVSDYYVNPLACFEQNQICNPAKNKCTAMDAYQTVVHSAQKDIDLNPLQISFVSLLSLDLWLSTISQNIGGRGNYALRAQEQVRELLSTPIPPDQWQQEVKSWFTTGLAKLQRYTVDHARGPENVLEGTYIEKPNTTEGHYLCNNQIVKSPPGSGTMSFSTLGVSIVLGLGGLLILTHTILDYVVSNCIQGRSYRLTRWAMDEKLQLQRLAFEGAGLGRWKSGVQSVPVTTKKQDFIIDVYDGDSIKTQFAGHLSFTPEPASIDWPFRESEELSTEGE